MAHFLVIGAGIGGLTAAHALLQQGHTAQVLEAAPALREVGAGVVLGANAMRALHRLHLHDAVRPHGTPVTHLDLRNRQGQLLSAANTTPFTRKLGFDNLGIHRAALQRVLLEALPAGTVELGRVFEQFNETPTGITASFADGVVATADALIGADGLRSRVRQQLVPGSVPRYAGYTCWRAVVDAETLNLPAGRSCETWGNVGRFGYVPVGGGKVYWFACLNSRTPQNPQFRAFRVADLQAQFSNYHAPIPDLLGLTSNEQLLWNDILDMKPLKQLAYGRVLLLGDAGHATTPNMGQGAGQAVEDAAALAACLAPAKSLNVPLAFRLFEKHRLARTTRIINQSRQVGEIAQLENPLLIRLRDAVLRRLPAAVSERQLAWLYEQAN